MYRIYGVTLDNNLIIYYQAFIVKSRRAQTIGFFYEALPVVCGPPVRIVTAGLPPVEYEYTIYPKMIGAWVRLDVNGREKLKF
jgi:hypothetical protein